MNKDKIRIYWKAYYEKNKDKLAKKRKAYREKNKDKIAKKGKAYYQKRKEEFVKVPYIENKRKVDYIYANGEAKRIQKQVPKLTQEIMLKLLNEEK